MGEPQLSCRWATSFAGRKLERQPSLRRLSALGRSSTAHMINGCIQQVRGYGKLIVVARRIDEQIGVRQSQQHSCQGVAFAPTSLNNLAGIAWAKDHVHGSVRGMDVRDLTF